MHKIESRHKIFVSAYACEPDLGSEIGVGWHWILEMSKYFDLWVLTRKSNQDGIEKWIAHNPKYNNIKFLYFDLPKKLRFWKKGMRGVRTYYNIWQLCTNKIVKKTMQQNDIKIFHHLTYGNVLWSVSSYGKKQFFIWGPVGGMETIPADYSQHYQFKGRIVESIRRIAVCLSPLNFGFRKRCADADLILCKTEKTMNTVAEKFRNKAVLFTDVAVEQLHNVVVESEVEKNNIVNYIAVGRLDPWRGFDILIEAFTMAVKQNDNIRLTILGKGMDKERLNHIISKLGVEKQVNMIGNVDRDEYYRFMQKSDVVVNPSLKEGAVTVSFDSMSLGKPLICIDTTGYTRYFSQEYAIVIPECKRNEMIGKLAKAIIKLDDSSLRKQLGSKAQEEGKRFTWDKRGEQIYKTIITALK